MRAVDGQAGGSRARLLSQDVLAGLFFCGVALVGLMARGETPEEMATVMRQHSEKFGALVDKLDIKTQ